jgi:CrcB protein
MSLLVVLGVGALGGVGAVGRFLLDGEVSRRRGRAFPFGTLAVNVSGSFALGVLSGLSLGADAYELWGVGLVGGYTTFSTWVLESHRLAEEGRGGLALLNFVASLALGVLAAWIGRQIA